MARAMKCQFDQLATEWTEIAPFGQVIHQHIDRASRIVASITLITSLKTRMLASAVILGLFCGIFTAFVSSGPDRSFWVGFLLVCFVCGTQIVATMIERKNRLGSCLLFGLGLALLFSAYYGGTVVHKISAIALGEVVIISWGFGIWSLASTWSVWRFEQRGPVPMACIAYITAITLVRRGTFLQDLTERRFLLFLISRICRSYRNLPAKLTAPDRKVNDRFRGWMYRASEASRELYYWVLTPRADSPRQLLDRLKSDLVCLVSGTWHDLRQSMAEPRGASSAMRPIVYFLSAGLPFALVMLLKHFGLITASERMEWLVIGCVAWACIYLLVLVNPIGEAGRMGVAIELLKHFRGK